MTPKQVSATTQQSQVQTKVVSGLKCPDCREKSVKVKFVRGSIVAGSAKCQSCGWAVRVGKFTDGIVAKCPCCGSFAFPALGWRSGKQPFAALSCCKCGWVASEVYMRAVGILLSANIYADNGDNGQRENEQVKRESDQRVDKCLDGVPAAYEAALVAYYRGDQPVCPFCGQRYREIEAERIGFGEIVVVTCLRCKCGVFPVKATVMPD